MGMARRGLATKISRVFGPEGGRTARLATRAVVLVDRLRAIGAPPGLVSLAEAKAEFESARAALPRSRWARIPPVRRLERAGGYADFASQGRLDILRDLGQARD